MLPFDKAATKARSTNSLLCGSNAQRLAEKGRRRDRVAIRTGDDRREIIAGRALADFKRRGNGQIFIHLRRCRGKAR